MAFASSRFLLPGHFPRSYPLRNIGSFISVLLYVRQLVLLVTRTPPFLTDDVHIWHNDCPWCVDYRKAIQITNMTMGGQGHLQAY